VRADYPTYSYTLVCGTLNPSKYSVRGCAVFFRGVVL